MTNLDGDPIRFPCLSRQFRIDDNGPFAIAMAFVLAGTDSRFRQGDVLKTTTELISKGITQDGAEPAPYEMGRWGARFMCDEEPAQPVDDDMYYAWVSTDFWDYDPNLVFYTKAEFIELFIDCCRNYVASHPERREEFALAMNANGLEL